MNPIDELKKIVNTKTGLTLGSSTSVRRLSSQNKSDAPYLNARRTWNDHLGGTLSEKNMWKMIGLISLVIAIGAVGGLVYTASQSKFIPYIVTVDKLGQSVAAGPAPMLAAVDSRVVEATVAAWISSARTVSPDVALERRAIFSVYAMIGQHDAAAQKMNEWLNGTPESNPFARAAKVTVDTEINSVLQQTPETWEVDWTETTHDRQGVLQDKPVQMRALVQIYFVAPTVATTDEKMRMNPLGLYVRDFSWGKQL